MNKQRSDGSAVGIIAVVVALLLVLPCLLVVVGGLGYFFLRLSTAPSPMITPGPIIVPQEAPVLSDPAPLPPPSDSAGAQASVAVQQEQAVSPDKQDDDPAPPAVDEASPGRASEAGAVTDDAWTDSYDEIAVLAVASAMVPAAQPRGHDAALATVADAAVSAEDDAELLVGVQDFYGDRGGAHGLAVASAGCGGTAGVQVAVPALALDVPLPVQFGQPPVHALRPERLGLPLQLAADLRLGSRELEVVDVARAAGDLRLAFLPQHAPADASHAADLSSPPIRP